MKWYDLTAWRNTLKNEQIGEELPDKRQSYSLDRERSVARDQKPKKLAKKSLNVKILECN